jgi:hypothetical protein
MSEDIFSPGREHVPPPTPSAATNKTPTPPPTAAAIHRRRRWGLWIGIAAVLLAAAGGGAWWWTHRPVDWEAVHAQNNHAIAVMEGYHYADAIPEFEKVVKMAPDWLPGRINLGIALLNASGSDTASIAPCKATFEEVLKRDPDNPHAHFCLGILLRYQKEGQEAAKHFEAVVKKVPDDAYAWYWLGTLKEDSEEQTKCFERARKLNHHLSGAIYGLAMNLRRKDPKAVEALLAEHQALEQANWGNIAEVKYSRMGPLAEVIGRTGDPPPPRVGPLPLFQHRKGLKVRLAPGARWAKASDLGKDTIGEVRRLVRERFGATMVVLDHNRDGRPDLFLAGAVVEKGQVRDLLLRNDGFGHFTDVTAEAGLAEPRPTLGCAVADFDNDHKPDLLLTGAGVQKLFRNTGKGTFEDMTAKAGLDKVKSVCLGAAFVDLDQDSDLDLLLCEFARNAEEAAKRLKGENVAPSGGLAVFLHVGEAPETKEPMDIPPPLECKFRQASLPELRGPAAPLVGLAASDMEGDRDLDFLLLGDQTAPSVVSNDRLLKFRRADLPEKLLAPAKWNGALVLDADHDGRSDLVLLSAGERPRLLLNRARPGDPSPANWFEVAQTDAPRLRQAVAVDLNLDSWTDVVGLSSDGIPVLLLNEGGKLALRAEALGRDADWPGGIVGLAVCPLKGDGPPDLFVWSEEDKKELQLYDNRGNGGNAVHVELLGRNSIDGQNRLRCNADGIGVWAAALVGELWAGQENTTLSAGLGQSRQPLLFGIARHPHVEVLRMRWPDGTLQAEPDINDPNAPRDLRAGKRHAILQRNRLPGSCPILFAWDGRRFVFVNDFLGAGSVGETGPDGACRPPRPEESVKIESEQLRPRDGQYVLKITEPMDETTYLDRLQLVVVDQPPGVRVYPDERFVTAGPPPSQQLIAFGKEIFPVRARDHRGRDVTQTLRHWDRAAVDDFAKRAWVGFAEEHAVELDFGDRLAKFGVNDRLYLCLAGWTEYPFPESSWAAHQAGMTEQWPVLERQDESGKWRSLGEAGFPAGLPRMMLRDVTGKLTGPRCRLRLRTNMHVSWDQIFVAADCRTVSPGVDTPSLPRATCLEVQDATLSAGRLVKEHSPDGRAPALYDWDRHEDVPLVRQAGQMTRFGDVTELLRRRDDRFVIFGPGDDLTMRFDAGSLPPLPAGWQRSFVLRTAGYCKDTALSTAHGSTVGPLPFQAMRNYPYGPDQHYPHDPLHLDYLQRFLTREVQSDRWPAQPRR